MTKQALFVTAALVAGLAAYGPAARADGWGQDGAGASVAGVAAAFVSGGSATSLPPAPFFGSDGGFQHRHGGGLASFSETLAIASAGTQIATLTVTGSDFTATASAKQRSGTVTATAGGTVGSLQITLQLYPPPPASPVPTPLLSITASGGSVSAGDSAARHQTPVVTGSASFTSLVITGSLVNGDTLNGSGVQGANDSIDIPLSSGSTRVTLNQQTTSGQIVCKNGTCTFIPAGIATDALAIHLDHVSIGGKDVTGDIVVGDARAHIDD